MNVNKAIIHLIIKEQGENPIPQTSANLMVIDDKTTTLTERLNDAFRKNEKVLRTEFTTPPRTFQTAIRQYTNLDDDATFIEFTLSSLDRIIDLLAGRNLATGGYFVFLDYVYRNTNYVGVFIVRDSEEIIFKRNEGDSGFVVNTTNIVNTDKLAMAARIDKSKLNNNDIRYLHFTNKQANLANYFIEWIEASLAEKSIPDTENLIRLINSLVDQDMPIDPETNATYTLEKFKNKLYDNILSSGRVVRMREISRTFWDNEDFLPNKIEELGLDISGEFRATEKILKRLKKYDIASGKIKLSFSQADIDSGRIFSGDNENQLIIESEELRRKFNELE